MIPALPTLARLTVGVLRAVVTTDSHGDEVRTWPTTPTHTVTGCAILPVRSAQNTEGRWAVLGARHLIAPLDADIAARDRLLLPDGRTYEVVGEPDPVTGPTGAASHLSAVLHRWEG